MKLTPELEKIALQEAEEVGLIQRNLQGTTGRQVFNFVENFLDALPNSEQDYKAQLAEPQVSDDMLLAYQVGAESIKRQLVESQAREAKLREALNVAVTTPHMGQDKFTLQVQDAAVEALALPSDATALNELIAKAGEVMRERCVEAGVLRNRNGNVVSKLIGTGRDEAILTLPGVTLEDLNHD